jgi:hypothetical protein
MLKPSKTERSNFRKAVSTLSHRQVPISSAAATRIQNCLDVIVISNIQYQTAYPS